jgi:hypothetical protein
VMETHITRALAAHAYPAFRHGVGRINFPANNVAVVP